MRQILTTNGACILPVYKQLGNKNILFLDTLTLHDKVYENDFLWNLVEL